jgi:hypothetical protein
LVEPRRRWYNNTYVEKQKKKKKNLKKKKNCLENEYEMLDGDGRILKKETDPSVVCPARAKKTDPLKLLK